MPWLSARLGTLEPRPDGGRHIQTTPQRAYKICDNTRHDVCGWQANFLTAYAMAHPWEDFSGAHRLHIIGTLETARPFDMIAATREHLRASVSIFVR